MMTDLSETPFRLYVLNDEHKLECKCACDDASVGDALIEQRRQGNIVRGIMYRPVDGEPGNWLLGPWV